MTHPVQRPAFLAHFTCLGADCEDTCCKGWNMQIDASTHARYCGEAPELLQSVTGEEGHTIMKRDPKTDYCVKFEGGLCGIQKQYGEDFLGDACYSYPRVTRSLGDKTIMTAALSCPEIVRLALLHDDAFAVDEADTKRLPQSLQNYLPQALNSEQAMALHHRFLNVTNDTQATPERLFMRIFSTAQSLDKISIASWPDAVPYYLEHADSSLPAPAPRATDQIFLLQALCGLVAAAKKVHQPRLLQTISEMERALHVAIPLDSLTILPLPDNIAAGQALLGRWKNEWQVRFAPILRRYLCAQLSLALFPFAGFGSTLTERAAVIGIRLATTKLALMSACAASPADLPETDMVRAIQSLSRFLDHLAEPEFSLKIYRETGWLQPQRLRALLGDA